MIVDMVFFLNRCFIIAGKKEGGRDGGFNPELATIDVRNIIAHLAIFSR
jgi:hypothetical protein